MSPMKPAVFLLPFVFALTGCLAVLGYEPTPDEIEAIKRGEDPRANEDRRTAGESESEPATEQPVFTADQDEPGPAAGTILRWVSAREVIIEADEKRERVARADAEPGDDLDALMNRYTYGTPVRLGYPVTDSEGGTVYRDGQGRLLATIE